MTGLIISDESASCYMEERPKLFRHAFIRFHVYLEKYLSGLY
jgi:hypothetical protein